MTEDGSQLFHDTVIAKVEDLGTWRSIGVSSPPVVLSIWKIRTKARTLPWLPWILYCSWEMIPPYNSTWSCHHKHDCAIFEWATPGLTALAAVWTFFRVPMLEPNFRWQLSWFATTTKSLGSSIFYLWSLLWVHDSEWMCASAHFLPPLHSPHILESKPTLTCSRLPWQETPMVWVWIIVLSHNPLFKILILTCFAIQNALWF